MEEANLGQLKTELHDNQKSVTVPFRHNSPPGLFHVHWSAHHYDLPYSLAQCFRVLGHPRIHGLGGKDI